MARRNNPEPRGQPADGFTTPPHDLAAEQALLGVILRAAQDDNDVALRLLDGSPLANEYWRPAHEELAALFREHAAAGLPLDPTTILGALTDNGAIGRIDGAYLMTLIERAAPPSSIGYLGDRVRNMARLRRAQAAVTRAGQRLTLGAAEHSDDYTGVLYEAMADLEEATTGYLPQLDATTWQPLPLDDVLAGGELDPPPALVPRTDGQHLVYPGAVHALSGEPGCGKTWIALHAAAIEIAQTHTVAIIDFEDRVSRIVGRLLALGAKPDQIRDHLAYIRPNKALDTHGRLDLDRACYGATLVIIDGVTEAMTLHGLDVGLNPDVATFYALLPRWVADHGPAVILIDHVVKDAKQQGRWQIGGQHKLAGLDGVAYTVRMIEPFGRGKHGIARISIAKDRPGYIDEFALGRSAADFHLDATIPEIAKARLDPPEPIPLGEHGELRYTKIMAKISQFLIHSPGTTADGIEKTAGHNHAAVRQALAALIAEGHVETRKGPHNRTEHYVIEPFLLDDQQELT